MRSRLWLPFMLLPLTACTQAQASSVTQISGGGMLYTVATVDLKQDKLALYWLNPTTQAPYRTFEQLRQRLGKEGKALVFATNSGIYAPGPKPLGLHIENGQTLVGINNARSGGNFALLPNGVFWVRGQQAGVTETQAYKRANLSPTYATQSGPLLVQNGQLHPQFNKGGTSFKVRSGVGVCEGGQVKFAISAGPVNFYSFAVFSATPSSVPVRCTWTAASALTPRPMPTRNLKSLLESGP